jgi:hypothetical protein
MVSYDSLSHNFADWTVIPDHSKYEAKQGRIRSIDRRAAISASVKLTVGGRETSYRWELLLERLHGDYAHRQLVDQLRLEHPTFAEHFNLVYNVVPSTRENLLVLAHPEFIPEWLGEPAELMGMMKLSNKQREWKCRFHGEVYKASMAGKLEGKGCTHCRLNRTGRGAASANNLATAASTENFLAQVLRGCDRIQDATSTGQEGNSKDDVVVAMDGEDYAVQVKTLSSSGRNAFQLHMEGQYPPNMILYATDVERRHHVVCKCGDLPQTSL